MTNPVLGVIESRIASAPATDTVVRTSLDELTSVTLTRIPKKATPVVKIVHCGETVAMDSSDLTRESARRKLVEACGDDIQVFVQRSLLELGDYWTNVATDATVPVAERKGYLTCETDPWPRAVDADELLSELRRQIVLHVALPAHADVVLALWIAHTHWISGLIFTPYLWLTSPTKQCGKTTVLELCELLARRAWRLSNPSSAALLRVIASERPTLLLDEIDTINGPKLEDLTGILNDGFHVNGKTARCEIGRAHV